MSEEIFRKIFSDLLQAGKYVVPRGEKTLEIENYIVEFPPYMRFMNFESRKLSIEYIKQEFLWYLRGNKHDISIVEHATLWKGLINQDGTINSNYGQYIFGELNQFKNVIKILTEDKYSRRASMVILQPHHLLSDTKDYPCTYVLNFRIRNGRSLKPQLNMTVHMRSNDAVWGLGNDLPMFSFIHEMMYVMLRDTVYHDLKYGIYCHIADSFHVYERHWKMAELIAFGYDKFTITLCPKISSAAEVLDLLNFQTEGLPYDLKYHNGRKFLRWLVDKEEPY
jgi:thymidylate synthase